jgi:hypothetical protein
MSHILPRVKERMKELLPYFAIEYTKAYKTALVLACRDKKNGVRGKAGEVAEPTYHLMLPNDRLIKNPQIEGLVWVGDDLKKKVKWTMDKKYIITEKLVKEEKGADGAASPQSPGSSPGSPASPGSPGSPEAKDDDAPKEEEDLRVWLDDSCSTTCMNPSCGDKFGLLNRKSHCRLCGEIFCKKCSKNKIKDDKGVEHKFCEPCYALRTTAGSVESTKPLLQKPKEKQRILNLNGYDASFISFDAGDADKKKPAGADGKFCIKLSHRRSTRPQPIVAFATSEERDQWLGMLKSASRWAPQPITSDPLLRKAFQVSFNKFRWRAWVWSGWNCDGTESELIADVLYEVLERDIFGSELHKLGELPRKMIRKAIIGSIEQAVSAAWTGIQKGLAEVRGPIEKAAESMLAPLFDAEQKIKQAVQPPMEEGANKGLESASGTIQEQFGSKVPVFQEAGAAQIRVINLALEKLIKELGDNYSQWEFQSKFGWMMWRASWSNSYEQEEVTNLLDKALRGEVSSAETRTLANDLIYDLRDLNQSFFTVLRNKIKEAGPAAGTEVERMKAAYPDIMLLLGLDLELLFQYRLAQATDALLRPPLTKATNEIINTAAEPLMSAVPDILKDVLDPARTCKEIIEDVLTKVVNQLVTLALEPTKADMISRTKAAAAKGIA